MQHLYSALKSCKGYGGAELTSAESISRHVSVQIDISTLFVNKLLQTICIFHVFLVQLASIHRVRFLLC